MQINQYLLVIYLFFIGHHELPSPTKLPAVVKDTSKFPNNMANDNMKSQASTKKKSEDQPPSVEKILRQAKKEANRNPQDWHKEYEERKKAAMEAMNSKKSVHKK